ncbi:integrin alpha-PS2-like isoform X2 [Lycorma delicatula]|uniref:integrin alpha-PS2-like isoform X2 n=1 Tax=Lycorma delicatula TaxID=130591 RepID=UPI003F514E2E
MINILRVVFFNLLFLNRIIIFCKCNRFDYFDTTNYVKYGPLEDHIGSLFGFSVSEYSYKSDRRVIVGAPKADTRKDVNIHNAGAVFSCHPKRENSCTEIMFDKKGNNKVRNHHLDEKSHQWFGATVRSSEKNGFVVACAPRYIFYNASGTGSGDPVGTCYVAHNNFSDIKEFAVCRTRLGTLNYQGKCESGIGASFSKDGDTLFAGGVGSFNWVGEVYSVDTNLTLRFPVPRLNTNYEGVSASAEKYFKKTNEKAEISSYLGYSITTGNFGSGIAKNDVAAGSPRAAKLKGKVDVYDKLMSYQNSVYGDQIGSYFGYSVCSIDINGDEMDDLIIGAPFYSEFKNADGSYDNGRVYFVYRKKSFVFHEVQDIRNGKKSKGRFGLALAALGDIDKDNYGDVAIGAPYDGPKERGAVYIYKGSKKGISDRPSQVIYAEDISYDIRTFGFSLSGGFDLDQNDHSDLVVGAYKSDITIILRGRPVINIKAAVIFKAPEKKIDLERKDCHLKDKTKVACVTLDVCLTFNGSKINDNLSFDVKLTLDVRSSMYPRMFFLSGENEVSTTKNITIQCTNNKPLEDSCTPMHVYVTPVIRDKLTGFEAEMTYSLKGEKEWKDANDHRFGYSEQLFPTIVVDEQPTKRDTIFTLMNCHGHDYCLPDLHLDAKPKFYQHVLGSQEDIIIDVQVKNNGEDAYETVLKTVVPPGLNYVDIHIKQLDIQTSVDCSVVPSLNKNNILHCNIGNPLPEKKQVNFELLFQPFYKEEMKPVYDFSMSVSSVNQQKSEINKNNFKSFTVNISVSANITLQGKSIPEVIQYNLTSFDDLSNHSDEYKGPQFTHQYVIKNLGPCHIVQAELIILWPSFIAGNRLLYLLKSPDQFGPIKCDFPRNLIVKDTNTWVLNSEIQVSSLAQARIVELPYITLTNQTDYYQTEEILTTVFLKPLSIKQVSPLWVVPTSSSAGATILIVIVHLLYKIGFFKRNRPVLKTNSVENNVPKNEDQNEYFNETSNEDEPNASSKNEYCQFQNEFLM